MRTYHSPEPQALQNLEDYFAPDAKSREEVVSTIRAALGSGTPGGIAFYEVGLDALEESRRHNSLALGLIAERGAQSIAFGVYFSGVEIGHIAKRPRGPWVAWWPGGPARGTEVGNYHGGAFRLLAEYAETIAGA